MAPLYAVGHSVCEHDGRESSVMECFVEISVCPGCISVLLSFANTLVLSVSEVGSWTIWTRAGDQKYSWLHFKFFIDDLLGFWSIIHLSSVTALFSSGIQQVQGLSQITSWMGQQSITAHTPTHLGAIRSRLVACWHVVGRLGGNWRS